MTIPKQNSTVSFSRRKRPLDLFGAVVVLVPAAPILLLLMLLICLETPGNPLFVQWRIGRRRKKFRLLKLRTMYFDVGDRPSHEIDPTRITKVGRFLRRTKLDELPQLWNILRGEMSFVGPRPCLPTQHELIAERELRGLHEMRPGITGPAQLAGVDMSRPRELAMADAEYLDQQSLRMDFVYILRTAMGKGAGDAVKG